MINKIVEIALQIVEILKRLNNVIKVYCVISLLMSHCWSTDLRLVYT
jgi:hypothetical protein